MYVHNSMLYAVRDDIYGPRYPASPYSEQNRTCKVALIMRMVLLAHRRQGGDHTAYKVLWHVWFIRYYAFLDDNRPISKYIQIKYAY